MDKTFLNPENSRSKKTKKAGIKKVVDSVKAHKSLIVFAIFILIGLMLITIGVVNNVNSNYVKMNIKSESELQSLINDKYSEEEKLRNQRNEMDNSSSEYKDISSKLKSFEAERYDLEAELFNVKSGKYNTLKKQTVGSSMPFIVVGVVEILCTVIIYSYSAKNRK